MDSALAEQRSPAPGRKTILYRITSEEISEGRVPSSKLISTLIIILNVVVSPIIGLLMSVRGNYDGKLSLLGLSLRALYFLSFLVLIYFDDRFERYERWARLLPKFLGVIFIVIQLIGVVPLYSCSAEDFRTCL